MKRAAPVPLLLLFLGSGACGADTWYFGDDAGPQHTAPPDADRSEAGGLDATRPDATESDADRMDGSQGDGEGTDSAPGSCVTDSECTR